MKDEEFLQQLDGLAQTRQPAPAHLGPRIVANLPPRDPIESLLDWLGAGLWRGAMAAILPLAVGFALGVSQVEESRDPWFESQTLLFADTLEEYDLDEI